MEFEFETIGLIVVLICYIFYWLWPEDVAPKDPQRERHDMD